MENGPHKCTAVAVQSRQERETGGSACGADESSGRARRRASTAHPHRLGNSHERRSPLRLPPPRNKRHALAASFAFAPSFSTNISTSSWTFTTSLNHRPITAHQRIYSAQDVRHLARSAGLRLRAPSPNWPVGSACRRQRAASSRMSIQAD